MSKLVRFGVSIDSLLLERFDALICQMGHKNRSEAIRDMIRQNLVDHEWKEEDRETVGTITLVYDHHTRELENHLTSMQHECFQQVTSTLHVHLDEHNCLEVLVVKGSSKKIIEIADRLIGTRGVKHGKLTMSTIGKDLV